MTTRTTALFGGASKTIAPMALALCLGVGQTGFAQIDAQEPAAEPQLILAEASTSNPETVRLLAGLGEIEGDMLLGMLFLHDGMPHPEGSHFLHPRPHILPGIKDGLAAVGVTNLDGLLEKLEAASEDQEAAGVASTDVLAALTYARTALNPSSKDVVVSIVEQTREMLGRINASGPTEVFEYHEAWALLMVARGRVDLLLGDDDPAIVAAATQMGQALDDVILSMPDPNASAPVEVDPAPMVKLLADLEALAGTI